MNDEFEDESEEGQFIPVLANPTPLAPIIDYVELAIANIEPDSEPDGVKETLMLVYRVKHWIAEQEKALNERLMPFIERNGAISIGPWKWFIGYTKPTEKCVDAMKVLSELHAASERINEETGEATYDESVIRGCLSTNAFKVATTKKLLGAKADGLFVVPAPKAKIVTDAPKPEKRPKIEPSVKMLNTDFVR